MYSCLCVLCLVVRFYEDMLLSIYLFGCSLCNTKATSQQTLLAHADGKKHRGKAKGFHAKQQESEQSTVDKKDASENASNGDLEQKKEDLPVGSGVVNAEKKRKLETLDETGNNGEVVQAEESKGGGEVKKAKKQDHEKKINWKKLITSALKSVRIYQLTDCRFRLNFFLATCNLRYPI